MTRAKKLVSIVVLSILTLICTVAFCFFSQSTVADASGSTIFAMEEGASVRLTSGTVGEDEITNGIRFAVEMDEDTYKSITGDYKLYFFVAKQTTLDTSEESSENAIVNYYTNGKKGCYEISKFSTSGDEYYAYAVFCNFGVARFGTVYNARAFITDGSNFIFADPADTARSMYQVVNSAVMDSTHDYAESIMGEDALSGYSLYGTETYPIEVEDNDDYSYIKENKNNTAFSGRKLAIASNVTDYKASDFADSQISVDDVVDVEKTVILSNPLSKAPNSTTTTDKKTANLSNVFIGNYTQISLCDLDLTPYKSVAFYAKADGTHWLETGDATAITNVGGAFADATWQKIAFVKEGDSYRLYLSDMWRNVTITNLNEFSVRLGDGGTFYVSELVGVLDESYVVPKTVEITTYPFTKVGTDYTSDIATGYTKTTQTTFSWNTYNFTSTDLTPYTEVRFAVKSNGSFGVMSDGLVVDESSTGGGNWLEIKLVKNSSTKYELYYGSEDKGEYTLANNNLTDLNFRFGDNTYYISELYGVEDTTYVNPYTKIADKPFTKSGETVTTEKAAGFEECTKLATTWNKGYTFNSIDLTPYTEIKFAVKSNGSWYCVMNGGSEIDETEGNGGNWLEIKLVKNSATNWQLYYGSKDEGAITLAHDSLSDIQFKFGTGTYYVTELLAIKDETWENAYSSIKDKVFSISGTRSSECANNYDSAVKFTTTWNQYSFIPFDLTPYTEVKFAVMSDAYYGVYNGSVIGETNGDGYWLEIKLVKNSATNYELYYGTSDKGAITLANDNLSDIKFQFGNGTFYVTELVGIKDSTYVNPYSKVQNKVFEKEGNNFIFDIATGYTTSTRYDMTYAIRDFASVDLTSYTQVKFAIKSDVWYGVYYNSAVIGETYANGEWLEIKLVKNSETNWQLYYGTEDKGTIILANDILSDIQFKFGDGSYLVSELVGIIDPNASGDKYYNGSSINTLPAEISTYLSYSDPDDVAAYLVTYPTASAPKGVKISWLNTNGAESVTIQFSFNSQFSNIEKQVVCESSEIRDFTYVTNLIPQRTYYYRVIDSKSNTIKEDSFVISDSFRLIAVDGVTNMRDIGGKLGADDNTVQYGLVYRSASLANVTTAGIDTLVNELGIKTELDARIGYTASEMSCEDIAYVNGGIWMWDYLMPTSTSTNNRSWAKEYIDGLKTGLLLFTDISNYPIVFHCSAGADRTGTYAFMLEGLLGVSYEDMVADFELTSFYSGARWRSNIVSVEDHYEFDDSGVMEDDANNLVAFDKTYNYILDNYGAEGKDFAYAIEQYLTSDFIGLTTNDIAKIRHILLGTEEHVYGDWVTVKDATLTEEGKKERVCSCGKKESLAIPQYSVIADNPFTLTGTVGGEIATGYTKSTELTTTWGKSYTFNSIDLTPYSVVKFAVKSSGYYCVMNNGSEVDETTGGGNWLEIKLVKNSGNNWQLYYGSTNEGTITLANNNLSDIKFKFGTGTYLVSDLFGNVETNTVLLSNPIAKQPVTTITSSKKTPNLTNVISGGWVATGTQLNSFDLSLYSTVVFYVKGDGSHWFELKDTATFSQDLGGFNNDAWHEIKLVEENGAYRLYFDGGWKNFTVESNLNELSVQLGDNGTFYVSELIYCYSIDLLQNSACDYVIVYENGCSQEELDAVNEFVYFFEEATGVTLTTKSMSTTNAITGREKYIVIGKDLADANNIYYDGIEKDTGYAHVVFGKNLYIYGNTGAGTLQGVYGFFSRYFNLEIYYVDEYTIDSKQDLSISSELYFFNPTFTYGLAGYGEMNQYFATDLEKSREYRNRLGFVKDSSVLSGGIHNFTTIISTDEYQSAHPNWFTTVNDGNNSATTLNLSYNDFEMAATVAEKFEAMIAADSTIKSIGFSAPDVAAWSQTDSSIALYNIYGTYSAEYILFMNKVASYVQSWLAANYPTRNVDLYLLAYGITFDAPVTYNEETGNYEAKDSSLMLFSGDNVKLNVYFAPVDANMYKAFTDSCNAEYAEELKKWHALGNETYVWMYSLYSGNYLMPLSTVSSMSATYNYFADNGVEVIYNQSSYDTSVAPDWSRLKLYIQSGLLKDANFDVTQGVEDFCNAYFKDASSYMLELFNIEESWYNTMYEIRANNLDGGNSKIGYLHNDSYLWWKTLWDDVSDYSKDDSMLQTWLGYIDSAYEAIAKYETTDPELYKTLHDRIELESLTIRYIRAILFGTGSDTAESLYNRCIALGMTSIAETIKLSDETASLERINQYPDQY